MRPIDGATGSTVGCSTQKCPVEAGEFHGCFPVWSTPESSTTVLELLPYLGSWYFCWKHGWQMVISIHSCLYSLWCLLGAIFANCLSTSCLITHHWNKGSSSTWPRFPLFQLSAFQLFNSLVYTISMHLGACPYCQRDWVDSPCQWSQAVCRPSPPQCSQALSRLGPLSARSVSSHLMALGQPPSLRGVLVWGLDCFSLRSFLDSFAYVLTSFPATFKPLVILRNGEESGLCKTKCTVAMATTERCRVGFHLLKYIF